MGHQSNICSHSTRDMLRHQGWCSSLLQPNDVHTCSAHRFSSTGFAFSSPSEVCVLRSTAAALQDLPISLPCNLDINWGVLCGMYQGRSWVNFLERTSWAVIGMILQRHLYHSGPMEESTCPKVPGRIWGQSTNSIKKMADGEWLADNTRFFVHKQHKIFASIPSLQSTYHSFSSSSQKKGTITTRHPSKWCSGLCDFSFKYHLFGVNYRLGNVECSRTTLGTRTSWSLSIGANCYGPHYGQHGPGKHREPNAGWWCFRSEKGFFPKGKLYFLESEWLRK